MAWRRADGGGRGGRPWRRIRARVLRRDSGLCQHCLKAGRVTAAAEVHHLTPVAMGGTDDMGNLLALCPPCHEAADLANRGAKPRPGFDRDGWPVWPD